MCGMLSSGTDLSRKSPAEVNRTITHTHIVSVSCGLYKSFVCCLRFLAVTREQAGFVLLLLCISPAATREWWVIQVYVWSLDAATPERRL